MKIRTLLLSLATLLVVGVGLRTWYLFSQMRYYYNCIEYTGEWVLDRIVTHPQSTVREEFSRLLIEGSAKIAIVDVGALPNPIAIASAQGRVVDGDTINYLVVVAENWCRPDRQHRELRYVTLAHEYQHLRDYLDGLTPPEVWAPGHGQQKDDAEALFRTEMRAYTTGCRLADSLGVAGVGDSACRFYQESGRSGLCRVVALSLSVTRLVGVAPREIGDLEVRCLLGEF